MDIQQTFYIVAIVFMVVFLLLLLCIAILIFYIRKKVEDIHESIEESIATLTSVSVKPIRKVVDTARSVLSSSNKRTQKR